MEEDATELSKFSWILPFHFTTQETPTQPRKPARDPGNSYQKRQTYRKDRDTTLRREGPRNLEDVSLPKHSLQSA